MAATLERMRPEAGGRTIPVHTLPVDEICHFLSIEGPQGLSATQVIQLRQRYGFNELAEAPPEELFVEGQNSADFQRTVSRLHEMQSAEYRLLPVRR